MVAARGIDEEAVPTLFEWAGGGPALLRLTTIFYEKYVPEDPQLGPLFANMAPDHPERVAADYVPVLVHRFVRERQVDRGAERRSAPTH